MFGNPSSPPLPYVQRCGLCKVVKPKRTYVPGSNPNERREVALCDRCDLSPEAPIQPTRGTK